MERDVKEAMVKVCEAEQRTKFLTTLMRMGLLSRDVRHFERKQLDQQRSKGPRSRGGGNKLSLGHKEWWRNLQIIGGMRQN